jgi:RHS repeat-associated protein
MVTEIRNGVLTRVSMSHFSSARYVDSPILRTPTTQTYSESAGQWYSARDTYYYLTDANNNVTAVTNSSGVVERYVYTAFGKTTMYDGPDSLGGDYSSPHTVSSVGNTRLFAGKQADLTTALIIMGGRIYNPSTGQFLTTDPLQSDSNLYRYCLNDPTGLTDPSGMIVNTDANEGWTSCAPEVPSAPASDLEETALLFAYSSPGTVFAPDQSRPRLSRWEMAAAERILARRQAESDLRDRIEASNRRFGAMYADTRSPREQRMGRIGFLLKTSDLAMTTRTELIDEYYDLEKQPAREAHPVMAFFEPRNAIPGIGGTSAFENVLMTVGSSVYLAKGLCGPGASYHGNDLRTRTPAQRYSLRDRATGEILKYGETTLGNARYSKKYLNSINADMLPERSGSKADMHDWQHQQILDYKNRNGGRRPVLNKTDW